MGERKVLNKYIPADFDPSLIPRGKKLSSKDGTVPVRMMLPFTVQCSNCHTFLYRGRKFNSKKEAMGGPDGHYKGITRWRFYIKCSHCSRPLTFLTDPQHADYEMESGGNRTYEIRKDQAATEEQGAKETEHEEKLDPMKALENRVLESQKEMATLDQLEEIRAMNARHVKLDTSTVLLPEEGEKEDVLTAEDEALVKSIQFGAPKVKRLGALDEQKLEDDRRKQTALLQERHAKKNSAAVPGPALLGGVLLKAKRKRREDNTPTALPSPKKEKAAALSTLLDGYGSNSSDSE